MAGRSDGISQGWLAILVVVVLACLGLAAAWGSVGNQVKTNTEVIAQMQEERQAIAEDINAIRIAIERLKR